MYKFNFKKIAKPSKNSKTGLKSHFKKSASKSEKKDFQKITAFSLLTILSTSAIIGGSAWATMHFDSETTQNLTEPELIAETSVLSSNTPILTGADETVYLITDESGAVKSKYIGSTLYTGSEALPFEVSIKYYLNDKEISAHDLAGKSGHVKIVYSYNSTKGYLGKNIPFLAATGLSLDANKFSDLKLTNGKIIRESNSSYLIAGYGISGLNQNLNTDLIPDEFIIEAEVKDFKLGGSYTVLLNDVIADLDTSKLSTVDDLVNSVYQLSDGLDQLTSGAGSLSSGLASANDGAKKLYQGSVSLASGASSLSEGANALAAGASSLSSGASELSSGLNTLSSYSKSMQSSALSAINSALNTLNSSAMVQYALSLIGVTDGITLNNYHEVIDKVAAVLEQDGEDCSLITELKSAISFAEGINEYLNGVISASIGGEQVAAGANALYEGATSLAGGAATLSEGANELSFSLGSLVSGTDELYKGSITLLDGLNTFKTSGVDKLVDFAADNLSSLANNLRSSVTAASSYKSYGNVSGAKSVKFIVKTPSI